MSTPTAPLPQAAVDALHSVERKLAGLRNGESTVVNGTAVSLEMAEAVARYKAAAARTAAISKQLANPEYVPTGLEWDDLAHAREIMTGTRDQLAAAGHLKLIEDAS